MPKGWNAPRLGMQRSDGHALGIHPQTFFGAAEVLCLFRPERLETSHAQGEH